MELIEREAKDFAVWEFFNSSSRVNISNLADTLHSKLSYFRRPKEKLEFLKILREKIIEDKISHEKECTSKDCEVSNEKEMGIFVVEQEVEVVLESLNFEAQKEEEFTSNEKIELFKTLDKIKMQVDNLGLGQEIIFDEIDELKEHLKLGKKNWFQLLKGKLLDLGLKEVLDKETIQDIYSTLSKGFSDVQGIETINGI